MLNNYGGMQVSYENYRKIFCTSQRHVKRELGAVLMAVKEKLVKSMAKEKGIEVLS